MADVGIARFQIPHAGVCWWCGNVADSAEHKFKASDLRKIAGASTRRPEDVYKSSSSFQGALRSLNKGSQIKWGKNLCQRCNNETSQPFDLAYDQFVDYLLGNFETLYKSKGLDWADIYGVDWQDKARCLSRYLVKQLGCMMATAQLPVPKEVIDFLNGATEVQSILVLPFRNWLSVELHKLMMDSDPDTEGLRTYSHIPETESYETDGALSGADYALQRGYIRFTVEWRAGAEATSMHDVQRIRVPFVNVDRPARRQLQKNFRTLR